MTVVAARFGWKSIYALQELQELTTNQVSKAVVTALVTVGSLSTKALHQHPDNAALQRIHQNKITL